VLSWLFLFFFAFQSWNSASKIVAEKIALASGNCVALRPYGIYGEGEERHFPRMIGLFSWGLFMQIGHPADKSDWVHADNLVEAIVCASVPRQDLAGQAFFIGDGQVKIGGCVCFFLLSEVLQPCNTIDLCAPLWTMVSGQGRGSIWLPYWLVYFLAWICELLRVPLL
jgi:hypothetical protein